ncbi:MAG TPA: 4,5-DOPA dioxygenase extradiol [Selenomonadales bacterium]|nr:4,5-DOPA dioxygenase extradiol [Selenomonadales bacterium]
MMNKMPVLFIGHGSPMNIVADNGYTRSLAKLGRSIPRPQAIVVVSAHWLTDGTHVTCEERPKTIYDFYGFPPELYRVQYACPGAPECAARVAAAVGDAKVVCDQGWGLDHAAWAVLTWLYPDADIPVSELSLDIRKPAHYHYELAKALAPLRSEGVLIIGSGNIVHNLRMAQWDEKAEPYDWAVKADEEMKQLLQSKNHTALINYEELLHAQLAIPTNEHYLPMLYTLALQEETDELRFIHEGIQNASVSMRCFLLQSAK